MAVDFLHQVSTAITPFPIEKSIYQTQCTHRHYIINVDNLSLAIHNAEPETQ